MKSFNELLEIAKKYDSQKVVVAAAHDEAVIQAIKNAHDLGIIEGILVGDSKVIYEEAEKIGLELLKEHVYHETDPIKIALKAVELVRNGQGDMLMKGLIDTSTIMKAVLNKENGLRTNRAISHVSVFQIPSMEKLVLVTDCAINIAPDLARKADIIRNAIEVSQAIGVEQPKVAVIAAIEHVNPDMPATIEAACLSKMAERGQIKGAIVDGPLALDLAVSKEAVRHKKVNSPVAGDADILVVPYIEVGNVIFKTLSHMANAKGAGVVMGAKVPVVLMSRSDTYETKTYAILLAMMISRKIKNDV